ncbi:hypothetical protein HK405_011947, partial [Cladochytrium tenue]
MAAAHEGGPRGGGARGRLLQAGMLVCWSSMSAMVGCPLAMTDGAAVVLRDVDPAVARRLWGRDPDRFFTAGQWMTERPGGSDVSNGETWAEPAGDGSNGEWLLTGFKWFSSATDADVALALARTAGTGGRQSLFLVDVARAKREGTVRVERLKRKHGTTPLPTAELRLERAVGRLVGEEGRGVKGISPVLNVTRLHTALHAVSCLTRAAQVVMAYSRVRRVRGRLLLELPLHRHAVAGIQLARLGLTHLALLVAELQGKTEAGTATAAEGHLGRALTPLTKAYVSTRGYAATRDCCEALGGLGCIETEDAGLNVSRVLRDALVATIWEGTSNVLAMDFWRVVNGGGGSSGGPVRAAFKEVLGIEIDVGGEHSNSSSAARPVGGADVSDAADGAVAALPEVAAAPDVADDLQPRMDLDVKAREYNLKWRKFLHELPAYSAEAAGVVAGTRGIVMTTSRRWLPLVIMSVRNLRELGCELPVELVYSSDEIPAEEIEVVVREVGVRPIDIAPYVRRQRWTKSHVRFGVAKPHSILASTFEEALFLDPDVYALRDPTFLFQSAAYRRHGALFWPDFVRRGSGNGMWGVMGLDGERTDKEMEFESGQIVVDKRRAWRGLKLTQHMAEEAGFYFNFFLGDKETFFWSFRASKTSFLLNPHYLHAVGTVVDEEHPTGPVELEAATAVDASVDAAYRGAHIPGDARGRRIPATAGFCGLSMLQH